MEVKWRKISEEKYRRNGEWRLHFHVIFANCIWEMKREGESKTCHTRTQKLCVLYLKWRTGSGSRGHVMEKRHRKWRTKVSLCVHVSGNLIKWHGNVHSNSSLPWITIFFSFPLLVFDPQTSGKRKKKASFVSFSVLPWSMISIKYMTLPCYPSSCLSFLQFCWRSLPLSLVSRLSFGKHVTFSLILSLFFLLCLWNAVTFGSVLNIWCSDVTISLSLSQSLLIKLIIVWPAVQ